MRTEIRLSPAAIRKLEEILSSGKAAEARVIGGRLVIFEIQSRKKYEVVVTPR